MSDTIRFTISGVAMSVISGSEIANNAIAYDGGSQGAHDAVAALKATTGRRVGKGYSYPIQTTREGAQTIGHYCRTVGEGFCQTMPGDDPETARDGRALLAVADRITAALGA